MADHRHQRIRPVASHLTRPSPPLPFAPAPPPLWTDGISNGRSHHGSHPYLGLFWWNCCLFVPTGTSDKLGVWQHHAVADDPPLSFAPIRFGNRPRHPDCPLADAGRVLYLVAHRYRLARAGMGCPRCSLLCLCPPFVQNGRCRRV